MEIDLSLNRSLEELIASYWEFIAENGDIDPDNEELMVLEGYLMKMDVL